MAAEVVAGPGSPGLRRSLTLPALVLYGLGTILGAGIYALVGKVGGPAGMHAPVAFCAAAVLAGFTALSYGEMSARFPKSAGEALWVGQALRRRAAEGLVGWALVTTGVVSAATVTRAFVGYLRELVPVAEPLAAVVVVVSVTALAAWGIRESAWVAAVTTVVEIAGLLLVLVLAGGALGTLPARLDELVPPMELAAWGGIAEGAFLAFYAFIGFEDMVNVAEEARDPTRDMPRAILAVLLISTALYVSVALVSVLAVPVADLVASEAPLATVVERSGHSTTPITLIGMVAVLNGALVQIIMASRVLYGMARDGVAPRALARIHPRRRTPLAATAMVGGVALVLALGLGIVTLARATSFVVLGVFLLVHLSLVIVKRRGPPPAGVWRVPLAVPVLGGLLCAASLAVELARAFS